jgi:hypothetical protein
MSTLYYKISRFTSLLINFYTIYPFRFNLKRLKNTMGISNSEGNSS